jgi:plasmid stabilization system protein ParE
MAYKVRFSHSARADINHIVRYISIDNRYRALRFGRFLIEHAMRLGDFPERGRAVPELGDESIREIIVRAYRIVYRVDHHARLVEIIRFWHAAQDNLKLSD